MFESQPLNDSPSPSSLMASSSSSLSRTWKYGVFASLHGLDVPKTYVLHIRKQLNYNGITMFDDQGIERGQTTSPALTEAIRESRILIVVLSKNYASSSLCLDELLEILKCKEHIGQIVMPVYYGVDKSHVRKQIGDFGVAFNETCARKTEEERRKWSQALNYVGKIAGEHFLNGDNAAIMIEKIAQRLRLVNPVHEREGRSHRTWTRRPRKSVRHLRKQLNYNGITMFDDQGIERGQTSLSISGTWRYHVFASFHGPDVRRTFFSHLRKQFNYYGIAMFDDQWIERSQLPALTQAIRESKISIVLLSKNYASSSWCLDELLEILKCKENIGQIVMTVFHGVEPSDVRKQTGDFGIAFNETCARKTEEERQRWSHALTYVGNIAGEHFQNWDNESEMIEKIARDISKKLDTTISRDFEDSARLETHSEEIQSLLHLDNKDEAMIVFDPFSKKRIGKRKHRCSTAMAFLVVINLLLEIASAVSDQLFSIRKPYFAKISLVMSVLSVVFSILDLTYKIRAHKARFRCKWPIPWFYYPARGYRRIFGSFTDTVLLCCVVGGLIVSTINYSSIDKQADGPIKVSIWPLFFAIGMVGSKFMEKPVISKDSSL